MFLYTVLFIYKYAAYPQVTGSMTWRKPFDALTKQPILKDGRGNRTPVELFAQGAGALEDHISQFILAA